MKTLFTFIFFLSICLVLSAKQIDENTAKLIGKNFIISQTSNIKANINLTLVYKAGQHKSSVNLKSNSVNYFYIFNCINSKGFVIVSADDNVMPILGYSLQSLFLTENLPSNISGWLLDYSNQIQFVIENNLLPTKEIKTEWKNLLQGKTQGNNTRSSVSPLLQTTWDQSPYYNDLCPYDNSASQHTVTGCVATAMAQIMKYWNYPSTGTGTHSYTDPTYGLQSANFGTTTYNWSLMPNSLTSSNSYIATLKYQCGVSVNMSYGIASNGGSGAYVLTNDNFGYHAVSAQSAFTTYFGYNSSTIQGVLRSNYPIDANWIALLKNELDNGRPVQYVGRETSGGHTWVCDGYDPSGYMHMNWGWGGIDNGYYSINSLIPSPGINFNLYHSALIGIKPIPNLCNYSLSQNSNSFSSNGGTGNFNIITSTNCAWNVTSNNPSWLHITSSSSGTGNGNISYSVDPNTNSNTLNGSITITGSSTNLTYNITVTGLNCTYSLSPTSSTPCPATGGSGSFSINTASNCVWSAFSNKPLWLHITSATNGIGNSTLLYSVDANTSTNTVSGTISVVGQTFTVTISGASVNCAVSFIPSGNFQPLEYYEGDYSFVYNINSSCAYSTLSSSPDWLNVTSALNNVIKFHVSANLSFFPRNGFISMNGTSIMITQAGNTTTNINELSQSNTIKIYPNPVSNELTIENIGNNERIFFEILNSIGQSVYKGNFIGKIILPITNFISGVYLIILDNGKVFEYKKIIKLNTF